MSRRTLVTGGSGFLGTHVVAALLASGREVLNVSTSAPRDLRSRAAFLCTDVRDGRAIERAMASFRPSEVVHLAARTGFLDRPDPEGFEINVAGTETVACAARRAGVDRFILASSNVVDWEPVRPSGALLYGASKVVAERVVASAGLPGWCIVRPCYAWGPWLGAPFRGFFLAIAKGRYLHLGAATEPKRMGYAGNMAYQIQRLLDAPREAISGRTFHLADDAPITIRAWADAIARELGVGPPATVPDGVARAAARAGDALSALGLRDVPLTTARLVNMRRENLAIPIHATRAIVGPLPFSMEAGVAETVRWLRSQGLVRSPKREETT
jgi:GlcNAc-P-P-Und epimerase